jgi:hypothetical protein
MYPALQAMAPKSPKPAKPHTTTDDQAQKPLNRRSTADI